MNRPVPYEAFDAGWPLLVVCGACLLFYALFWLTEAADDADADEPVEHYDRRATLDREAEARNTWL